MPKKKRHDEDGQKYFSWEGKIFSFFFLSCSIPLCQPVSPLRVSFGYILKAFWSSWWSNLTNPNKKIMKFRSLVLVGCAVMVMVLLGGGG